jgi:crotonobetainyl-CoA:carnitine CoA-transferase CaiB-like acyl-CoA transferase
LPFEGLRVVTLEQAVAAPFASRQLADLGAEVIKIERPDHGDPARDYDRSAGGISAYFAWLNRGKRSIALDLKSPEGRDVCAQLVGRADILLHNLAPGAVERLGFGYDDLAGQYPRLIWCGISGYGPDGPYRDRKAYDLLVQAESGVVSLTGSAEAPAKVGISIADIAAGLYAYSSILAALISRDRTGTGRRIDISMLECLTEWMMPPLYAWMDRGVSPGRMGARHNMIVPYGAYSCSDGTVMFAVQNDREWRRLCAEVLSDGSLADDPRFLTNAERLASREALETIMESRFRHSTVAEISARLAAADIATGVVNSTAEVADHPQLRARERWVRVQSELGSLPALLPPHNIDGLTPRMGAVPALGADTGDILDELRAERAGGTA